jgi:hypothetical protein
LRLEVAECTLAEVALAFSRQLDRSFSIVL